MVEPVDAQDDRDPEGADDLDVHPELRDPAHHLRAGDVEDRLIRSSTVTMRIVLWSLRSRFQPNQLWVSDAT